MTERPLIGATILAHQGGWDEILLVAGPIVVIVAVLAIVKRRVDAGLAGVDGDDATPERRDREVDGDGETFERRGADDVNRG